LILADLNPAVWEQVIIVLPTRSIRDKRSELGRLGDIEPRMIHMI
jgi:hypothetical protein